MSNVKIVNVVATADLRQPIDIDAAGKLEDFLHDPETYAGRVTYHHSDDMTGKVSIFPSGKMISVGSRSLDDAFDDLKKTMRDLVEKKLARPTVLHPRTRNIVATVDFEGAIDLEEVSDRLGAIYEPEQFPGAILRVEEPGTTALLFASGKAVIVGAREIEDLNRTVVILSALLNTNAMMKRSSNRSSYRP